MDKAHNQLLEELGTKGSLGLLVYLGLWTVIVVTLIRKHRPLREDVLAYAILGALAGYFVQNLFLFDTPPTILQFVLLTAWVAGRQKSEPGTRTFDTSRDYSGSATANSKLSPLATGGTIIPVALIAIAVAHRRNPRRAALLYVACAAPVGGVVLSACSLNHVVAGRFLPSNGHPGSVIRALLPRAS